MTAFFYLIFFIIGFIIGFMVCTVLVAAMMQSKGLIVNKKVVDLTKNPRPR